MVSECVCYRECVALQDPYCAWDNVVQRCTALGSPDWSAGKKRFIQSIAHGEHKACGRVTAGQLESCTLVCQAPGSSIQ
jgi:hypothetical protein